ncbi:MAG: hypothetical protein ING02_04480 [Roseomonas sp.]|nr:hypothetical protein [Roseomonas sp.]
MTDQLRALLRQPEMLVGTWRAARGIAPEVTEHDVRLRLDGLGGLVRDLTAQGAAA